MNRHATRQSRMILLETMYSQSGRLVISMHSWRILHHLLPLIVAGLFIACEETSKDPPPSNIVENEMGIVTQELTIKDDWGADTLVFKTGNPIHVKYSVVNSSIDTVLFWRVEDESGLIPTCGVSLVEYDGVEFDVIGPPLPITGVFLLLPDSSWNFETIFINAPPGDYELDAEMNFSCCAVEPEAEMVVDVDWDAKISVVD